MGLLLRKARRDIARSKGTFLALTLMVSLGTMAMTGTYGAYANLQDEIARTDRELRFHDGLIAFEARPELDVMAAVEGIVTDSDARLVVELPVTFPGGRSPIVARLISVPDAGPPTIDGLRLKAGSAAANGKVVAEAGFAAHHELDVGSTAVIHAPTGNITTTVSGIATSAEYLWPSRNVVEHMPDVLRRWGVLYVQESVLQNWTASPGQVNQVVFRAEGNPLPLLDSLQQRLGEGSVQRIETKDNQASTANLNLLVGALGSIAWVLPVLFLVIVGLSTYVLLSRLVHLQRANIGLLRAMGYPPRRILLHYLAYGPLISLLGTLVGFALGFGLSFFVTDMFSSYTSLTDVPVLLRPRLVAIGLTLSLAFTTAAAILPALQASRLSPATAMRPPAPAASRTKGHPAKDGSSAWLPMGIRLGWRNIARTPRRAILTLLGVALAVSVVLAPPALIDSLDAAIEENVSRLQRADAVVVFAAPIPVTDIGSAQGSPGISLIEPVLQIPTSLRLEDSVIDMTIVGLHGDQAAIRLQAADAGRRQVSEHGILLSRVFERRGVSIGDAIDILGSQVTVLGFVNAVGPTGFIELGAAQELAGLEDVANQAYVTWSATGEEAGRADLEGALPVAAVQAVDQSERDAKEMLRVYYGFVWVLVAFGAVIAAAIVFNTMAINVLEESQQYATLRTLGHPMTSISQVVLTETLVVTLPGIVVGLGLGVLLARYLAMVFTSDLFVLDLSIADSTYWMAMAGGLAPALVAAWPNLRAIARIDLGRAVRERTR